MQQIISEVSDLAPYVAPNPARLAAGNILGEAVGNKIARGNTTALASLPTLASKLWQFSLTEPPVVLNLRQEHAFSDHNLLAIGVALENPSSSASERRTRGKGVLHKLEISTDASFDLCKDCERRCYDFR